MLLSAHVDIDQKLLANESWSSTVSLSLTDVLLPLSLNVLYYYLPLRRSQVETPSSVPCVLLSAPRNIDGSVLASESHSNTTTTALTACAITIVVEEIVMLLAIERYVRAG